MLLYLGNSRFGILHKGAGEHWMLNVHHVTKMRWMEMWAVKSHKYHLRIRYDICQDSEPWQACKHSPETVQQWHLLFGGCKCIHIFKKAAFRQLDCVKSMQQTCCFSYWWGMKQNPEWPVWVMDLWVSRLIRDLNSAHSSVKQDFTSLECYCGNNYSFYNPDSKKKAGMLCRS